jgi:hypothetical protein
MLSRASLERWEILDVLLERFVGDERSAADLLRFELVGIYKIVNCVSADISEPRAARIYAVQP